MIMIDMEIPKQCYDCPCHNGENGECRVTGSRDTYCDEPPRSCPLLPIEPRGDAISRQAALKMFEAHSYPVRYGTNSIENGMTLTGIRQVLAELPSVQPKKRVVHLVARDTHSEYWQQINAESEGKNDI